MNIVVHIDRIVLDGVSITPQQRAQLHAAIEAELGRLLAEGGITGDLAVGGAVPSIDAGSIAPEADATGGGLGTGIARAVYGGIGGPGAIDRSVGGGHERL